MYTGGLFTDRCVVDISEYPDSHDCMVYSTSTHDVPPAVSAALEGLSDRLSGSPVDEMLTKLINTLERALGNKCARGPDPDDMDIVEESEDEGYEIADGLDFSDDDDGWFPQSPSQMRLPAPDELVSRMAADLTKAKLAGFKVGYSGSKYAPIVCISYLVTKLGISDEAMEAWQVDGRQYLVCLIRYTGRYYPLEEILGEDEKHGRSSVEVHVDLCDSYKPTLESALNAFTQYTTATGKDEAGPGKDDASHQSNKTRQMRQLFISKPLNALLQDRFIKILRYRYSYGFAWEGAERYFNDIQGKSVDHAAPSDEAYFVGETVGSDSTVLPLLAIADHLVEGNASEKSFPLIAMQFVLRHFVRCTEFCLVCHCKTNDAFEALKPYVCSNRLCLFQYMSLGFGPSLEWEIISQPNVVDLLVSFTYASAKSSRLPDFPTGLGFLVPLAASNKEDVPVSGVRPQEVNASLHLHPTLLAADNPGLTGSPKRYGAKLLRSTMELVFPNDLSERPVTTNDWIAVNSLNGNPDEFHCRVLDTAYWPTVQLGEPVHRASSNATLDQIMLGSDGEFRNVTFVVYDTNFDDLNNYEKQSMMVHLLDLLPTIEQMAEYLSDTSPKTSPTLAGWRDRIPKSALDILRWIVASNRSCIVQENPKSTTEDSVCGVDGYLQFRFAQGAPDKEQRFIQSVAAATAEKNLKHPTLFAWHGSPLGNWHSILREGLHFRETMHGRAYGHGVYMSSQFNTSRTYMGSHVYASGGSSSAWPQSKLKIATAISLNEVVNMPDKFVSTNPHFVVAQLDWIQTRYLFVRCTADQGLQLAARSKPPVYYEQDPRHTAAGPDGAAIVIPLTAFSQQRRLRLQTKVIFKKSDPIPAAGESSDPSEQLQPGVRNQPINMSERPMKRKIAGFFSKKTFTKKMETEAAAIPASTFVQGTHRNQDGVDGVLQDDAWTSDDTDGEDLEILFASEKKENKGKQPENTPQPAAMAKPDPSKTDFVPGTLEEGMLPLLGPPTYATPGASKALQRELKATIQIQENQPMHELGWYVDPNLISTVYQWIVELHSFDVDLPISKDLRKANLKSIVLEIRFWKDYPISPPFVRVIRPRFLGFQQGGGGHVTAGGALCMELLTNSGWSAVSNIESVLLQVRMAISSTDPHPARLEPRQDAKNGTVRDYGVGEAVSAYMRACQMHGWEVPKDFNERSG